MSRETHIAGSDDQLIAGLHFAGRNTASYIVSRQNVSFAAQTASNFRPAGSRLMRFSLADQQGWLDGGSVRLIFKLTNLPVTCSLHPIVDSPPFLFTRLRIIANRIAALQHIEA